MKKSVKFFLLSLLIVLAGCAVKLPQMCIYLLTSSKAPFPARIKYQSTHDTLLVTPMAANPGYDKKKMVYMTDPAHLNYYTRHEWVAPPAKMLTPLIIDRIQDMGYFRAVVTPPYMGKTDYRLETRLIVLQQEFLGSASQVRCMVQANLINVKTKMIVSSQRFQAVVPAAGRDPQSGVVAANVAANRIAAEIAHFTVEAINK